MDYDSCEYLSNSQLVGEDDSSSDNSSLDHHLYEKCIKDLQKMKNMKRKLEMAMKHKSKKKKVVKKSNDGFTRFSPTAFMNVISSLSPEKKAVIDGYGFGSLLMFNKCFVPNKFATWVARLVDSKSGDIIRNGKVISLSEESVHFVLDLPLGTRAFPSDSSIGKDIVLSKFGKDRIPPVSFFADKLISNEQLSNEDMLICFLVVALSSFLCPNTNIVPSPKYFGVFEDIDHIKDFKWCAFVLEWLLDHIKAFNRGKSDKLKRCQGLGGCLYYLVVVYLDHIDFRQRQVADFIPRISVWKQDMIQFYCSLDLKSPGVYGYRPLLEFEKTCYYKAVRLNSVGCADDLDSEFCAKMESVSGCKLPFSLKLKISKLIDEHCFNCGLSVNMDINSLGNVSKEFQDMFAKMFRHICKTDVRTKDLVLDIMKAIAETDPSVDDGAGSYGAAVPPNVADSISDGAPEEPNVVAPKVPVNAFVPSSSRSTQKNVGFSGTDNVIDVELDETMRNLRKSSSDVLSQKFKSKPGVTNVAVDNPLCDITNVRSRSGSRGKSSDLDKDVIYLDNDNVIVPDSVSPSPFRHRSRLAYSKVSQGILHGSQNTKDEDVVLMQTIPFTVDGSPHITPNLPRKSNVLHSSNGSDKRARISDHNDSSPVICIGSRSFAETVKVDTKKSDDLYNLKFGKLRMTSQTSSISLGNTHGFPADSSIDPESLANRSDFKVRNSSTGGKIPIHGPRRMVRPSRVLIDDYDVTGDKFKVSKSEIANYEAICRLAQSRSSNLDALYFGGVRCTYWSLGESMKPGGKVNNFVVAAFCYHLFCRPDGHPDISKRHYFFSNISENLLKDHDEVAGDVMMRAFDRSSKARPLFQSNMLYFPTFYEDHWFVFVVDIKDKKFVFLDSYYSEVHAYQQYVRAKMIPEFQFWWNKFVKREMNFEQYGVLYPSVPKQSAENNVDSGIYAMMFLEHWTSPRSSLFSLFSSDDIVNIRIKLANEMLFNPRNTGNKTPVISFDLNEEGGSE
ncbi:hypothetical protein SORBI_3009G170600 [Sorghum bicolor]|uniref:Ubiquitin-like protease family profile domain-containing protein n=1 Tax=Sorghum bicolor TaxID=4558 RepID=A0A1Z5R409_SORBI|nr:hypothetical protein SORBI_3009G170600 [Sorghum bicolor]